MRPRIVAAALAGLALAAIGAVLAAPRFEWPARIWVRSVGVSDEDWGSARLAPDGDAIAVEFAAGWDDSVFLRRRSPWWERASDRLRGLAAWSPISPRPAWDRLYDEGTSIRRGDVIWVEFVLRPEPPDASRRK